MKNKLQKVKGYVEEHKTGFKYAAFGVGMFISGCVVSTCINDIRAGRGIERIHDAGFIKFFDPATGNEVDVKTVCGLIKDRFNL